MALTPRIADINSPGRRWRSISTSAQNGDSQPDRCTSSLAGHPSRLSIDGIADATGACPRICSNASAMFLVSTGPCILCFQPQSKRTDGSSGRVQIRPLGAPAPLIELWAETWRICTLSGDTSRRSGILNRSRRCIGKVPMHSEAKLSAGEAVRKNLDTSTLRSRRWHQG